MKKWIKTLGIVLAALTLTGCGPKADEIGGAIMMATPVTLLVMILPTLFLRVFSKQFRKMKAGRDYLPLALAIAAALGAFIVGTIRYMQISDDAELLLIAGFAATSSALLYGLLSWGIFESRAVDSTYGTFLLPTIMLTHIIPSAVLLFQGPLGLGLSSKDGQFIGFWLWVVPGFYFVPGAILFLVLLALMYRKRKMSAKHADILGESDHVANIMS
mgnify:CR=1 FL=1